MNILILTLLSGLIVFLGFILVYFCRQIYYFLHPRRVGLINSELQNITTALDSVFTSIPDLQSYNFVELGSGLGQVTRYIAKNYLLKNLITVELDWTNFVASRLLNSFFGTKVEALRLDIFDYIPPKHSIFYCYLFPKILNQLVAQNYFKDCYVISLTFEISGKKPLAIYPIPGFQKQLLLYKFDS